MIDWRKFPLPGQLKSNIPTIYAGEVGIYIVIDKKTGEITNLQTSRCGTAVLTEYDISVRTYDLEDEDA